MGISERMAQQMLNKLPLNAVADEMKKIAQHIEDVSEAQDELAKALMSVYANQVAIAKHLKVKLPKPLVKMEVEN